MHFISCALINIPGVIAEPKRQKIALEPKAPVEYQLTPRRSPIESPIHQDDDWFAFGDARNIGDVDDVRDGRC